MKIKEFVKATSYKIDKLFGSRSENACNPDVEYDQYTADIDSIKVIENLTGETIYDIIKGASPLSDFIQDNLDKTTIISNDSAGREIGKLSFEDFNVYFSTYISGVSGEKYVSRQVFMNVRRVDLPLKNDIKPSKESRLYIFRGKDNKIYKLPLLPYPKNIVDFIKWLRTSKKISTTPREVWNKTDNISNWGEWNKAFSIPKFNLKTQEDIDNYIDYLDNDFFPKYQPKNKVVLLKNPIEIKVTNEDITKFIYEVNNRYKIYR